VLPFRHTLQKDQQLAIEIVWFINSCLFFSLLPVH
jgi:hypothetical protein